jgi:hypothetical protein
MHCSLPDVGYRFEILNSAGEVDATLTYETDDTLELTQQEEAAEEHAHQEEEGGDGESIGKKRRQEVGMRVPELHLVQ